MGWMLISVIFLYFYDGLQILNVMLIHWVSFSIVFCNVFLALIHLLLLNGVHVASWHKGHVDIIFKAYPEYFDPHYFIFIHSGHLYLEITL